MRPAGEDAPVTVKKNPAKDVPFRGVFVSNEIRLIRSMTGIF
jgi:hypothetical protein